MHTIKVLTHNIYRKIYNYIYNYLLKTDIKKTSIVLKNLFVGI